LAHEEEAEGDSRGVMDINKGVMEDMVVTGVMGDMIKAMVVTDMEAMAGTMVTVMATEETGMEADTTKATDMEVMRIGAMDREEVSQIMVKRKREAQLMEAIILTIARL